MSGISTGIGLISGIDTASLIAQLMAIESRPKILALNRQMELESEQAAFLSLNSKILSLESAAGLFYSDKIFSTNTATSSDDSILTASANTKAVPGTYQFIVDRLVSTHQLLSTGFTDADTTELGLTEMTFEWGNGGLSTDTQLKSLNEGEGVERGTIRITDSASDSATIDLSKAVTIGDVLDAINSNSSIEVTARVEGDHIVLEGVDEVQDSGGSMTASDLGIAGTAAGGTMTGSQINAIYNEMGLKDLNDGNGVYISSGLDAVSFTVNTRSGDSYDIILGERTNGEETDAAVTTLQGVIDRISEASGGNVTAAIGSDGVSLQLTDNTTDNGNTFEVIAGSVDNEQTAIDLGIFGTGVGDTIAGDRVLAGLNSVLTKFLNGGYGLSRSTDLTITDRAGNTDSFDFDENSSLSDILSEINDSSTIDVTVGMNTAGNGLLVTDNTGSTLSNLIISGGAASELGIETEVLGTDSDTFSGTNLQLQYVTASTLLDDLNYGQGIGKGEIRITDGYGSQVLINIGSDAETVQDVISEINSLASAHDVHILARINDTGDGFIIEAQKNDEVTPYTREVQVESISGTTAKDLGILGQASGIEDENNFINGSYEKTVTLEATDTLNDVISAINNADINVTATLINDGTGINSYHLSLTSDLTGSAGEMLINSTGADFDFDVLSEAEDAVVFFGSDDPAKGMLITSTTNTLDNVINGVTIDLKGTSSSPVELTIARDLEGMVSSVQSFVDAFNAVMDQISTLDSYDSENETKSILFGNSTVSRIQSQLQRMIFDEADGLDTQFTRLVEVGITFGEEGKIELDEERLREAMTEDLEAVNNLFAAKEVSEDTNDDLGEGISDPNAETTYDQLGVAEKIKILADQLTNSIDGTLTLVNESYDTQIRLQEKRIEDFDVRLDAKQARLEQQFAAMEQALASLQAQQNALSSIMNLSG